MPDMNVIEAMERIADDQRVEIEVIVRVRNRKGAVVGSSGVHMKSTGYMDVPETKSIMSPRQRRMIAEAGAEMGVGLIRDHFNDRNLGPA